MDIGHGLVELIEPTCDGLEVCCELEIDLLDLVLTECLGGAWLELFELELVLFGEGDDLDGEFVDAGGLDDGLVVGDDGLEV